MAFLHAVNELMAGSGALAHEKPAIHPAFQVCCEETELTDPAPLLQ